MTETRPVRTLWRSTDGGKTWEVFGARPGSYLWALSFPASGEYDDGYNRYRLPSAMPPQDSGIDR